MANAALSEPVICEHLYRYKKEGAAARHSGVPCPYPANSLAAFMHSGGWLTEDLRLALCRANPSYAWGQAQFDKTPRGIGPA